MGFQKSPKSEKANPIAQGGTKALQHWDCTNDKIILKPISNHRKQTKASEKAHQLEKEYRHRKGFANIKTKGI